MLTVGSKVDNRRVCYILSRAVLCLRVVDGTNKFKIEVYMSGRLMFTVGPSFDNAGRRIYRELDAQSVPLKVAAPLVDDIDHVLLAVLGAGLYLAAVRTIRAARGEPRGQRVRPGNNGEWIAKLQLCFTCQFLPKALVRCANDRGENGFLHI